jgi:hypothetical protein
VGWHDSSGGILIFVIRALRPPSRLSRFRGARMRACVKPEISHYFGFRFVRTLD